MTIKLGVPEVTELKPRITVFGVGGAGGNAVANMIRSDLQGVEFVVANTDAQALTQSPAERRIQLGTAVTQGLGAGSRPEIGAAAAEESLDEILNHLSGAHMIFITAGMGGGTGTGAAPIIARAAREQGILTVGVVTKPFHFEGARRMRVAESGIAELQQYVDTLIIIPNQNLFRIANEKTTFAQAFAMADEVLHSGVRGITDLMVMPGLINLDFADIRTVMNEMGKAMMGTGEASGDNRAVEAAESAISNPLLDEVSMKGAKGVLIHITGGMDLTLFEVDEAANRIRSEVDPDANIIVGSTFSETLEGKMRVSVVATGIEAETSPRAGELPVQGAVAVAQSRRVVRPLSSSASVVAPSYNPVNATIRELQERVQTEIPAVSEPARPAPRQREEAPAPQLPQASVQYETPAAPAPALVAPPAPRAAVVPPAPAAAPAPVTRPVDLPPAAPAMPRAAVPAASAEPAVTGEEEGLLSRKRRRASNFFERMTSSSLGLLAGAPQTQAPRSEPVADVPTRSRREPERVQPERQAPTLPPAREEPAEAAAPPERLAPPTIEEEQLEIPAFLRRQAN